MKAARVVWILALSLALTFSAACGDDDGGEGTEDGTGDTDPGDSTGDDTGSDDTGDPPPDEPEPPSSDFTIELLYIVEPTPSQREVFDAAVEVWTSVITNALAPAALDPGMIPAQCGGPLDGPVLTVTGVAITVDLSPIDGPGRTLGAAGPCGLRNTDQSPLLGTMIFDSDDLDVLEQRGILSTVILHEMGHVLGFGTLWEFEGFLQDPSVRNGPGSDTHFTGPLAIEEFEKALSGTYSGAVVPVENSGQQGSADGHWRENVMVDELMTPSITGFEPFVPMSAITIAAFEDMPYFDVSYALADPFTVPTRFAAPAPEGESLDFNCKLIRPKFEVSSAGDFYALER